MLEKIRASFIISFFILIYSSLSAQEELGNAKWGRDIELARAESKSSHKPILILFQEIPGCSTCKNYGHQVLSHPLIVEAIENLFVPLAIHNNKTGKDKEVLNYFKEPAWNNPVVRIVDANLNDISERLSGNYSSYGLVSKMIAALMKKNIEVPTYVKLLEEELLAESSGTKKTYVGMYCFWSGEKCFAQAQGVVATKAGYMKGSEVVEITYNPNETNLDAILSHGKKMNCADKVFVDVPRINNKSTIESVKMGDFITDKESKFYIFKSKYKYLPMTELQATKVNLAIATEHSPNEFLSPRQILLMNKINNSSNKKFPNLIGKPIQEAWFDF